MKKEDEGTFVFAGIHRNFIVEVDNLSREERTAKRDKKRRESQQDPVRVPQSNIAGSEGLLIAVSRKGPFESPIWETTFHKNSTHRILIIHNIYAPNSYQDYQSFMEELNKHMAKVATTYKSSHLTTIVAGDFNATVSQEEHNFSEDEPYSPGRNQPYLTNFRKRNNSPLSQLPFKNESLIDHFLVSK